MFSEEISKCCSFRFTQRVDWSIRWLLPRLEVDSAVVLPMRRESVLDRLIENVREVAVLRRKLGNFLPLGLGNADREELCSAAIMPKFISVGEDDGDRGSS